MTVLIILFGVAIGTQYRVACLVPCTLIVVLGSAAIDHIHHVSLTSMVLTALATTAALQIGYIIGASLRSVLFAAQASSTTGDLRGRAGRIG